VDTEWGLHSTAGPAGHARADDVARNGNIFGTAHRAVRMIYYAREGTVAGASSWEMFTRAKSPGFGILSPDVPDQRFMIYWLYYHFNRHLGATVLDPDGTAPYHAPAGRAAAGPALADKPAGPLTPLLVTLDGADGAGRKLYLVAVNGSWDKAVPCRMAVRNFPAARARGIALSQGDADASPLVAREQDVVSPVEVTLDAGGAATLTLPPHSIVFVTIEP